MNIEELLHQQFQETKRAPGVESIQMTPNLYKWTVLISGLTGTPYEGGLFPILLDFTTGWPNVLPKVMFICPMFHPNVDNLGFIKLENFNDPLLQGSSVSGIISFVLSLMSEPNTNINENEEATKLFLTDKKEFIHKVSRIVNQSISYC